MHNYSNFCRDLKNEIHIFLKETVFPYFDRTRNKLILNLFYGILKTGSLKLSEIARVLKENNLGSTENRISIGLMNYDLSLIQNGIINYSYSSILKYPVEIEVDETDVIKPYGVHFESMGLVKDGSALNNVYEKGYRVSCITALTMNCKHPMPIYDVFHSETQKEFKSVNIHTFNGLEFVCSNVKDYSSVFVFDRGYDSYKIFDFFKSHKQFFVVRMNKNRKRKKTYLTMTCKHRLMPLMLQAGNLTGTAV